tara:strand:+ start:13036 stop:13401 length:366 start_codon:yes stop_codon:yes gene_type:complete
MALRLASKPLEVMWPVTIHQPQNGGKTTAMKISLKWKILDTDEFEKLMPKAVDFSNNGVDEPWVKFWSAIITGWEGVKGEKGDADLKFSKAKLQDLVRVPYVLKALLPAYQECIAGASVKN